MKDEQIQTKLLAEDGLTVPRALEIAKGMEAAAKNSKELHQDPSLTGGCEIVRVSGSGSGSPKKAEKKTCYRCGRYHDVKDCQFRVTVVASKGTSPLFAGQSRQSPLPKPGKKNKPGSHKKAPGENKWVCWKWC